MSTLSGTSILAIPKDVLISEIVRVLNTESICNLSQTSRGIHSHLHDIVKILHNHRRTMSDLREMTKLIHHDLNLDPIYERMTDYDHNQDNEWNVDNLDDDQWYIIRLPDGLSSSEFLSDDRSSDWSLCVPIRYTHLLSSHSSVGLCWVIASRE